MILNLFVSSADEPLVVLPCGRKLPGLVISGDSRGVTSDDVRIEFEPVVIEAKDRIRSIDAVVIAVDGGVPFCDDPANPGIEQQIALQTAYEKVVP